jgi:hypothetical protein
MIDLSAGDRLLCGIRQFRHRTADALHVSENCVDGRAVQRAVAFLHPSALSDLAGGRCWVAAANRWWRRGVLLLAGTVSPLKVPRCTIARSAAG